MTECIADETSGSLGTFHVCQHQDGTRSGLSVQGFCESRAAQSPSCQRLESFIPISPFKVRAADVQKYIYTALSWRSSGLGEL